MDQKSNETTVFGPLLSRLNLAGITVTMNAMNTVRANLDRLVTVKNAHHLAVIKANQSVLRARLARLP